MSILSILLIVVGLSGVLGCRRDQPPTSLESYTVRGEVVELPDPANPRTAFRVHHEAIDTFRDGTGKVTGMSAMTMEFSPAEPKMLGDLVKGDKIQMVFEIWWKGEPPMRYPEHRVIQITKLAADTALKFRAATPPANTPASGQP